MGSVRRFSVRFVVLAMLAALLPVIGAAGAGAVPALEVEIHDIQGAGHISPLVGEEVVVDGIVTAIDDEFFGGFWMQEEDANVDDDPATSEGIFVFTFFPPADTIEVGDKVSVEGDVEEDGSFPDLPLTRLNFVTVTELSAGNPLPEATVVGQGGRTPPTEIIDSDISTFAPDDDGQDFWESLEGMRLQINKARVISGVNRFGEFGVVADNGSRASAQTLAGGMLAREIDFNPELLIVDDDLASEPKVRTGDSFRDPLVGVLTFNFDAFKLVPSEYPEPRSGPLTVETAIQGTPSKLRVATYNVLNLDPGDSTFDELGEQIVNNLGSPDIIGLQEIQDNSGSDNDGVVSASQTYSMLIAAITTAGGPDYEFREIAPVDLADGGQPGANIRVGFLFNPSRVTFVDRGSAGPTDATLPVVGADGVELTLSPGRVDPANTAFLDSRKPLAGEFVFEGETYFVIVNHFSSKSGDDPLYGLVQPPVLNSEPERIAQAEVVNGFVDSILDLDADARVVVLGDMNDFEFRPALDALAGDVLVNLIDRVPQKDRYSFIFNGNSQTLDHILVTNNLAPGSKVDYVRVNIDFPFGVIAASDHDPVVANISPR